MIVIQVRMLRWMYDHKENIRYRITDVIEE